MMMFWKTLMSAKIFNFTKTAVQKVVKAEPLTNKEIFESVFEDVMHDWQVHAFKNGLNAHIRSKIPTRALGAFNADYTGDLNVISSTEQKIGMRVSIICPDLSTANSDDWVVGFHYEGEVYLAPKFMAAESYARALNILLFVEFSTRLNRLKQ